jgi:hypothetical protein
MPWLVPAFSLIVGVAGWYYLMHARTAASRLVAVEQERTNELRIRLRRVCGAITVMIAIGFYAGFKTDPDVQPRRFGLIWLAVMCLLATTIVLALIDVRLTLRLRQSVKRQQNDSNHSGPPG